MTRALQEQDPTSVWIVHDTAFLKQGDHSLGVQRQYTGTAGKITNCQVGVSLCAANRTEHIPVDLELYLPHQWLEDEERRKEARIPSDQVFKTKPDLALDMIARALPPSVRGEAQGYAFRIAA